MHCFSLANSCLLRYPKSVPGVPLFPSVGFGDPVQNVIASNLQHCSLSIPNTAEEIFSKLRAWCWKTEINCVRLGKTVPEKDFLNDEFREWLSVSNIWEGFSVWGKGILIMPVQIPRVHTLHKKSHYHCILKQEGVKSGWRHPFTFFSLKKGGTVNYAQSRIQHMPNSL